MEMADEQISEEQLECIDACEDEGSMKYEESWSLNSEVVEVDADIEDETEDQGDEKQEKATEKGSEKKARIFDADRFNFSGQCETCSAGLMEDKDHMEFLIEKSCAPTRSYFYRNAITKHWPDFQGLVIDMQPFCHQCKKHFWGLPDLTRHMYNMATHGVEDVRVLQEENEKDVKKEKDAKKSERTEKETVEALTTDENPKKNPNAKNRSRMKRRRQIRGEAVQEELQRRLKRAEEVAASIPEEEIPDDEQREINKASHQAPLETVKKIIKMASTKEPHKDVIELLNEIVCSYSPRWFEASYLLGSYELVNQAFVTSSSVSNDLASGRSNVALFDARWRRAREDLEEGTFAELTGKLNEQSQLSTADRERALRRIAENGDLWKNDECSPPGETFTCLVCDRKGRSLRIHLDEALWLTHVSATNVKPLDLPDCPIAVEASLSDMRNNPVLAHVYHYLGEENTRRLVEELSFKSNRVLRCPACMFHYRALRCSLPALFSHLQSCGFMKVESDFKDAHQTVALRISSLLAEARSGFRATSSIIDELIEYLSCDEGGLHLQRRGAVTMQSLKANPRVMAKIRQAVSRKLDAEEASKAKTQKKDTTKKTAAAPGKGASGARDPLRGVASKPMKNKNKQMVMNRRGGGPSNYRSNGVGSKANSGAYVMGTHVPTNIRSAPIGRSGGYSEGMLGARSGMDAGSSMQVGVYCEMCSKEFYGYSFMEANRFLHTHLMDALFRSRREPGQAKMAAQHLKCFTSTFVYNMATLCPSCGTPRGSLDGILHHITQLASSNDITAVQHMNVANELVSKFIECMNGTMSLGDLTVYVRRRFMT